MYKFLFFIFFLLQLSVVGQNNKLETIKWSSHKLGWENFKGNPTPEQEQYVASSRTGVTFSWKYTTKETSIDLIFEVVANFYPENSWVISSEKTPALLAHEQLHFDISELHARKLLKAFNSYIPMRNIRRDLNGIYKKTELERIQMQRQYDLETNHGLNEKAQEKWQVKISKELENN